MTIADINAETATAVEKEMTEKGYKYVIAYQDRRMEHLHVLM